MTVRLLAAPLLGLTLTAGAGAATFTPTTTADGFDGACDAHCTLREAIAAANAAPGLDAVHLGPGVYELTLTGAGEDAGATGDLDAADDLTLIGAGAATTVIDGRGLDRVLHGLLGGRLEVADLTVRNGSVEALGGGILGEGELVIRRSIVAGSRADVGGGVYAEGGLDVAASTFMDNTATSGGGIFVAGVARLENSTFSGNRAPQGAGLELPAFNATALNLTLVDNGPAANALLVPEDPTPLPIHPFTRVVQSVISTTTGPATEEGLELGERSLLGERLGLGRLAWNGGPTPTHAPLPGSPVLEAGGSVCPTPTDQRGRHRPAGNDPFGLPRCDLGAVELGFSGCATGGAELCLGERFRVTARFVTPTGVQGEGRASAITPDTGHFWFFDPANVEVVVKVLDACVPFERYWVFLAGLTNVAVEVTVEDTVTGRLETYTNPQGRPFQPILDTDAFATCG